MNIVDCLHRSAQLVPGKSALWFEGRAWTYKELYSRALAIADALTRDGLVGGDRVCLLLPNIPEFVLAYYAIAAVGAIPVSINVMSEVGEISHIVNDSCAHILITSEDLISRVPRCDMSPCLFSVYVVGSCSALPPTFVPFDDLIRDGEPRETRQQLKPSSPAAILYTSGTTGSAKGAVLTLSNIVSNVASTNHHTKTSRTDVLMCFLPCSTVLGKTLL
jgi:acyl-CoA synthetase (AMP-forming)/AMP-acid ligase II